MGLLNKLDRHSDLMRRMAETTHVNLGDALVHNRLSAQELRSAIMACTGCEGGTECPDWLTAHSDGATATPEYCRNQSLFERLKS